MLAFHENIRLNPDVSRYKRFGLFCEPVNHISVGVDYSHINGNTAIQAVGSTAQSWIIGAYGHFHFVQYTLVIFAVLD